MHLVYLTGLFARHRADRPVFAFLRRGLSACAAIPCYNARGVRDRDAASRTRPEIETSTESDGIQNAQT